MRTSKSTPQIVVQSLGFHGVEIEAKLEVGFRRQTHGQWREDFPPLRRRRGLPQKIQRTVAAEILRWWSPVVANSRVSWTADACNTTVDSAPVIGQHVWGNARTVSHWVSMRGASFGRFGAWIVKWTRPGMAFERVRMQ
jgi:hypothetical protein